MNFISNSLKFTQKTGFVTIYLKLNKITIANKYLGELDKDEKDSLLYVID